MEFKSLAIECISQYQERKVYAYGNIPYEKKETATKNFPIDTTDEVICLIDSTVFGSCKNGIAIGLKGIYWKNDWTVSSNINFMSWIDLVSVKEEIRAKGYDVILCKGNNIGLSGAGIKPAIACNLIRQLVDIYNSKENESGYNSKESEEDLYGVALAKISSVIATYGEEVNDNVLSLASQIIEFDDYVIDKLASLSLLESEVLKLSEKPNAIKKLNKTKVTAELLKYEFSNEEEAQLRSISDSLIEASQENESLEMERIKLF